MRLQGSCFGKSATVSIDDFYLNAKDQAKMREQNPGNTHLECIWWEGRHSRSFNMAEVKGPLMVVLFEGWMLGFKPIPIEVVKSCRSRIMLHFPVEVVNRNLEAYYDAWDKFINAWIVIKNKEPSCVYQWGLQVRDFVSRYFPAYKAYLPALYSEGLLGFDPEHLLVVDIDDKRNPILGN
ncbi:hypothetical protein IFM89_005655 [Coptis chinensis]|uniref:Uncharacterized protein n=1 Tax=Coptis chinensis TaxID=261450 RepID=A0A835GUG2_9MAGN|nr:hypothetical protein IFM89_005655 [Coptis chinensis]